MFDTTMRILNLYRASRKHLQSAWSAKGTEFNRTDVTYLTLSINAHVQAPRSASGSILNLLGQSDHNGAYLVFLN